MMTDKDVVRGEKISGAPVRLKITGIQTGEVQAEPIVLVVRGEYFRKDKTHYIFYTEYGENGEKIKNRLTFRPGSAELRKQGPGNSIMSFETGKRRDCHYHTMVGHMNLVSDTRRIHWEEAKDQRRFYLEYSLLMNDQVMSDYELSIEMALL